MPLTSVLKGRNALVLLAAGALLLPLTAWVASQQRQAAALLGARLASLDRIEAQRNSAAERLETWRLEYRKLEPLAQSALDGRWDDRLYQTRVLRVDNRPVSRNEADLYLVSTRPGRGGFFVIDSFKIQSADPKDSLFALHADEDRPGAVRVMLRGQQYLREIAP